MEEQTNILLCCKTYADNELFAPLLPSTQLTEGSIKMTGDQKYTFDLISEQHCNSFNLENIPAYRTAGLVMRKEPFVPIVPVSAFLCFGVYLHVCH